MHVVATNICVWIRTLVLEYIKEITVYHMHNTTAARGHFAGKTFVSSLHRFLNHVWLLFTVHFAASIQRHNLRNAKSVLGTHLAVPDSTATAITSAETTLSAESAIIKFVSATAQNASTTISSLATHFSTTPSTRRECYIRCPFEHKVKLMNWDSGVTGS